MKQLRSEDGFTIVELLIACSLGLVILFAAAGLMELAATSHKQTTDRVQAVQRGRLTLDLMTRQLRSQVCLAATNTTPGQNASLQVGEGDQVSFYASLSSAPTTSGVLQIDRRTLRFEPSAGNPQEGRIVEQVFAGTGTALPQFPGYPATPTSTRVLADKVRRATPGAPIFRYFKYNANASGDTVELAAPVSATDREIAVRIDVAFDAYPDAGGDPERRTVFTDQAYVRTADPTDPLRSPKCL